MRETFLTVSSEDLSLCRPRDEHRILAHHIENTELGFLIAAFFFWGLGRRNETPNTK